MFVELVRGGVVESRHRVHVAVADPAGQLTAHAGDPDLVTYMRSVAKPFQALPIVSDGAAERFGLSDAELALCCASHSSTPDQVEAVRALLGRIGVTEADLACGPHRPLSSDVAADYERRGVQLSPAFSNCSGKHAGMLALARHHGWPTAGYFEPGHPVQRRCLEVVSRYAGLAPERVACGTDGCGVVTFAMPLRHMALAWARLGGGGWNAGAAQGAAERLVRAMLSHPELLAGPGRPCTTLMGANPGRLVAKVGAEGVYAALVVDGPYGVALKIEDGHATSAVLAVAAVLAELGLASPESLRRRPVLNTRGATVGELRINGGLSR